MQNVLLNDLHISFLIFYFMCNEIQYYFKYAYIFQYYFNNNVYILRYFTQMLGILRIILTSI